ncbi:MAG: hypothetical protein ACLGSH_15810 [Acidobacteriota bacterium]
MAPEERFTRWAALGVPLLLVGGALFVIAIHLGTKIPFSTLFAPAAAFIVLQLFFYLCAFWVRRFAKRTGAVWVIALLAGLYGWTAGLMIVHYGLVWKLLPATSDPVGFTVVMIFITLVLLVASIVARKRVREMLR